MTAYIIRRLLYAIPILVGINVIVFTLFFFVNTPDDMANRHLGEKRVTPERIDRFKREHNLDLPYFYNAGWRRLGSVSARDKTNEKTFSIPGPGRYAITIEAPENSKEAAGAGTRSVSVTCSNAGRLRFGDEFAGGAISLPFDESLLSERTLPESVRVRRYVFQITDDGNGGDLTVRFTLASPGLRNRVALDYQDAIAFTERFTQTLFWQHSLRMLFFQYGKSMKNKPIGDEVLKRMVPSLTITIPSFVLGLVFTVFFAMILALFRGTYVDYWGVVVCVFMMSISGLFYILGMQLVAGKILRLFPISGYDYGLASWKFIAMPIVISVVGGLGGGVRFYRAIFLEEINRDYVRTARAKGLRERSVLFVHVLKNAMIPILTRVVVSLPFLISAGLVMESFFAIPGLGGFTLEGIQSQDFIVVQAMVSLGSFMYVIALLLTDISYTLVDPRVRLE